MRVTVIIISIHVLWRGDGSHGDGCNNGHVGGGGNYNGRSGNDSSGNVTMVRWVVVTMVMVIMVIMVNLVVGGNQVDEVVVAVMGMMVAAVTVHPRIDVFHWDWVLYPSIPQTWPAVSILILRGHQACSPLVALSHSKHLLRTDFLPSGA